MIKKLLRSAGFIAGLVVILIVVSAFIKPDADIYNAVLYEKKIYDINAEKDNTIDVFFAGDSEVYSAFLPVKIFENYGYTSYACSYSAQRLCDTYAMLTEAFKSQSPKLVVLETNSFYRYSASDKSRDDVVMNTAGKIFPVIKYHSRWKLAAGKIFNEKTDITTFRMKGAVIRKKENPYIGGDYMKETVKVDKPDSLAKDYLEKIIELCDKNDADLMFVSVPSPDTWSYARHNGMTELAQELNIPYVDGNILVDEIGIDWNTDTLDMGNHLNLKGALKFSEFFGKYIKNNYELPDHRDDKDYDEWYRHSELLKI